MTESEYPNGFVVFTGVYEVHYDYETAEKRIEELLDEGHDRPTMMSVKLSQENGTEPLGVTAHKVVNVARAGEIR